MPDPVPPSSPSPVPLRPASPVRKTARRAAEAGINLIWLVPLIALVVTAGLAWQSFSGRGTLIEIAFADATGITPGETMLKFREIDVGRVERVRFTQDLQRVVAAVRVDKEVAQYIDGDAQFWLVRPQVTARGVTRLDTVLTGAFIEGYWDATPADEQRRFDGLDRAPLTRDDAEGAWVVLATDDAEGLSEGAPVMFRGLQVGRMENLRVGEDGAQVLADVFVEAPHDARLTTATVFWDTSGVSVGLDSGGVSVNVSSLAALLQGGVQFGTFTSGGAPVTPGQVFTLNPDEATARANIFAGADADRQARFTLLLPEAVRGLDIGADVRFKGLSVGQVTDLAVRVSEPDPAAPGGPRAVQQVTITVSPARLGLPEGATADDATAFLAEAVATGTRARVTSAGLLGTSLLVELTEIEGAGPATIDLAGEPFPILPTAPSEVSDFTDTAQGLIARVGDLPIEETLKSAMDMMNSVTALASSQDTRAIPEALRTAITEAQTALVEIRTMVEEVRASGAPANASDALARAAEMAEKLSAATDRLPAILDSLDTATASAAGVDFAALATQLDGALADLRGVVGTPAAAALPGRIGDLTATLDGAAARIDAVVAELQDKGAVANLNALLTEASAAATSLREAAAGAPAMIAKLDAAAASVDEFAFAEISAEAEGILADLRAMLGSDDAEQLPRNLSDTLEAASGLLTDLRDGNAAGSLNRTLDRAAVAADEVGQAAAALPALITRLQQTAARADSVLASYGDRSAFNTEAVTMLRELRRATEAFGSLARLIERNPRAFILGR